MNKYLVLALLLFSAPVFAVVNTNQCASQVNFTEYKKVSKISSKKLNDETLGYELHAPVEFKGYPYALSFLIYTEEGRETLRVPLLVEQKDGVNKVFFSINEGKVGAIEVVTVFSPITEKPAFHIAHCEIRQKI